MFVALNEKGETIHLLGCTDAQKRKISHHQQYFCPHCKEALILKCGNRKVWHFAHQAMSTCRFSVQTETTTHLTGKKNLYQHFSLNHPSIKIEGYLPDIKQRPDLFLPDPVQPKALEFQCAAIPEVHIIHRSKGYQSVGIDVIWILGSNRLNRKGDTFRLSRMDQLCIRSPFVRRKHPFMSPYQIHYYCPETKLFLTVSSLRAIHSHTFTGTFHYEPLSKISLFQLFSPSQTSQLQLNQSFVHDYLNQKMRMRLQPKRYPSYAERILKQILYQSGWDVSLLPGWVGLPHSDYMSIETSPFTWQGILFSKFFAHDKRNLSQKEVNREIQTCLGRGIFKRRGLLCRYASVSQAVATYLSQLCTLGILRRVTDDVLNISPFACTRTISVRKRLQEDQAVIDYLIEIHR